MAYETRATLLLRLRDDDPEREVAWSSFCQLYEPIIAGFARKLGVQNNDISDVVQEVMLGFYAAQPRFTYDSSKGRFRSYLKTCVVHCISTLRRRRKSAPLIAADDGASDPPDPRTPEMEQLWEGEWNRHRLELAMTRVQRHYGDNSTYQAFYGVVIQKRPVEEVAGALGLSKDSVYQARSRVLARTRLELEEVDRELGE